MRGGGRIFRQGRIWRIAYSGIGRAYREISVMQAQCGALSPFQKHSLSFGECCVEEYASLAKVKASAPRYPLQVQTQRLALAFQLPTT
jgi:hypothetical protein